MTPESLRGYVEHGLRPVANGGVELCCPPELEAAIFVLGPHNGVWDLLPDVEVPVLVVAGAFEPDQPSASAAQIAERLPAASSSCSPTRVISARSPTRPRSPT